MQAKVCLRSSTQGWFHPVSPQLCQCHLIYQFTSRLGQAMENQQNLVYKHVLSPVNSSPKKMCISVFMFEGGGLVLAKRKKLMEGHNLT